MFKFNVKSHSSFFYNFIIFRADAHKRQKQEELEISDNNASTVTDLNQNQRQALKFGFSRVASSKVSKNNTYLLNYTISFVYQLINYVVMLRDIIGF